MEEHKREKSSGYNKKIRLGDKQNSKAQRLNNGNLDMDEDFDNLGMDEEELEEIDDSQFAKLQKEEMAMQELDKLILQDKENEIMQNSKNQQNQSSAPFYNPFSLKGLNEEDMEFDNAAYEVFYRFKTWWPIPTFDICSSNTNNNNTTIEDELNFPLSINLVTGTQIQDENGMRGINSITKKRENQHCNFWNFSNLCKTEKDNMDDEDDENFMEEPEIKMNRINYPNNFGDINKIKLVPMKPKNSVFSTGQKDSLVSAYTSSGEILIFDISKNKSNLGQNHNAPDLKFKSTNVSEGFALNWSTIKEGAFACGGSNSNLYVFDYKNGGWQRTTIFNNLHHGRSIEDIEWSPSQDSVFASCGCDGMISICDVRHNNKKPAMQWKVSNTDVNVISWNKIQKQYLVSGDDNGVIDVWDFRKLHQPNSNGNGNKTPSSHYTFHKSAITSIEYSPFAPTQFVATSENDICSIWDTIAESDDLSHSLNNIPDQVLFIHHGVKDMKDCHWHKEYKNLLVLSGYNSIHVFKPICFSSSI